MKKILTSSFLFCFALFMNLQAQPRIAGGHIDYACTGQDSFLVTLHVIADCNSSLSFNKMVTATPLCSSALPVSVQLDVQDSFNRTQSCSSQCDRCKDPACGLPFGFKEYVLTGIFDIGQSVCDKWTFSWQESKRSASITTGPASDGINLYATIDRSVAPCNATTILQPLESTIICSGGCYIFNAGGNDPDGDSVAYTLVSPRASATQDVTYNSPYSYDKPLNFTGFPNATLPFNPPLCRGFHLDMATGALQFKPQQAEGAILSYKIEEYRNGRKIGERVRDLMIEIVDCPPNNYPEISGMNGGSSYSTESCPGQTLSFTINSDDQDNDSVKLDWNGGIPGANLTISSGSTPTATFTWTPKESDASAVPYFFSVNAKDNACPPGVTVRTFRITVRPRPTAEYIITDQGNGEYKFTVTKINPPNAFVEWRGEDSIYSELREFTHKFSKEDTFAFQLKIIADCINIYRDTLVVEFTNGRENPLSQNPFIHLYPNPARGHAVLAFDKNQFAPVTVKLMSPEGRIAGQWQQDNPGELRIDGGKLARGIYLLQIQNNKGQTWHAKLVFE